ncbi:unnamed protein product, partial [Allacma fusca]
MAELLLVGEPGTETVTLNDLELLNLVIIYDWNPLITDNGLNGDLLSEDERSGSELGDDGDSMDSDKVGALNLSNDRLHNNNNSTSHHPSKNGSVNSQSNGHGQLGSSPSITPTAASVQAALAAIQAGQLSLNQLMSLSASSQQLYLQNQFASTASLGSQELQALQQHLQQQHQTIQQTLQQLIMFGQTAGSGAPATLPPQAQFYLQNQAAQVAQTLQQQIQKSQNVQQQQHHGHSHGHHNHGHGHGLGHGGHGVHGHTPGHGGQNTNQSQLQSHTNVSPSPTSPPQTHVTHHIKSSNTARLIVEPTVDDTTDLEELEQFAKTFKQRRIKL